MESNTMTLKWGFIQDKMYQINVVIQTASLDNNNPLVIVETLLWLFNRSEKVNQLDI